MSEKIKFFLKDFKNYIKIPFQQKGSSFAEALVATFFMAIIGSELMTIYPQVLKTTNQLNHKFRLLAMAEYSGEYATRWANFTPETKKFRRFQDYTDGDQLELTGDFRINRFQFNDPLNIAELTDDVPLGDEYKASIRFFEHLGDRAVLQFRVWYDENLNNLIDTTEYQFVFSTVVTEKRI